MVDEQRHIIQKVTVDIEVSKEKTAYEIKDQISEILKSDILPMVAEVLAEFSTTTLSANDHVRWETLALDLTLDTFDTHDIKQGLRELLEGQLNKGRSDAPKIIEKPKRSPSSTNMLEAFFYFLKHGKKPWWQPDLTKILEEQLHEIAATKGFQTRFVESITAKSTRLRLIKQFSNTQLTLLLRQPAFQINALVKQHREAFWNAVLQRITGEETLPTAIHRIDSRNLHHFQLAVDQFLEKNQLPLAKQSEKKVEAEASSENPLKDEEVDFYISNAGLVLLHPFFQPLLERLDLLVDKQIAADKKDQAVQLLHYLATRQTDAYEHELLLEKILCGCPVELSIDRNVNLTDQQLQEADAVLESCLEHWQALKSNSIDALRATFLQREGKITTQENQIRLVVERQAQDILLDQLPWGIHLIKLPWLEQLIFVEW